ncbi:MAG: YcxB family protein [Bacteroidales bacterium]|nr:YcxB family protein [Clostridium sp.]MCM1204210.1 YcxB family protein [Bacteroidales bacterium]
MEEEKITFSVQMTVKEVYRFTMYHVYHGNAGRFGLLISLAALVMLLVSFDSLSDQSRAVLTLVAVWYVIIEPVIMYHRAKGQVKRNKSYQQPLCYRLDGEGITVSQNEEQHSIAWDKLFKIVKTKSQYLIYSSKIYAFVFPMKDVGDCDMLEKILLHYTEGTGVKRKGAFPK